MEALWRAGNREAQVSPLHLTLQLQHEVRLIEQIAEGDRGRWLWRGTVSSSATSWIIVRVVDHEEASRSQFCWMSERPGCLNRNLKVPGAELLLMDP